MLLLLVVVSLLVAAAAVVVVVIVIFARKICITAAAVCFTIVTVLYYCTLEFSFDKLKDIKIMLLPTEGLASLVILKITYILPVIFKLAQ